MKSLFAKDRVTDQFRIHPGPEMILIEDSPVFPALALPIDKKDEFSCPPQHVEALAEVIPKVTKIVTIGWRAAETKFLDMLRNRLTGLNGAPEVLIVSGDAKGASESFDNLGTRITQGPAASFERGFSGLIQDQLEEFGIWLRSGKKGRMVAS